jgi:hypothetical protein
MPEDHVVPVDVLQSLLQEVHSVKEEVAQLREERAQDKAELAALQDDLKRFHVFTNTGKVDDLFETMEAIEARVNNRPTKPTQKTLDRLNQIAAILGNREQSLINSEAPRAYISRLRREGMTFNQLATVMELTVDRIRQLSRIAATDQRFNICWHPRKKNTKIFKLRRWDAQNP